MQLAHQFLLADISNAVPMPAGCQGRPGSFRTSRLNPFASACFPSGEIPAFIPAMRGRLAKAAE
jgi:hypothetical protein